MTQPPRWADRQEGGAGPEDEAAKLVRATLPLQEPSAERLARAQERLRAATLLRPVAPRTTPLALLGAAGLVVAGAVAWQLLADPAPAPQAAPPSAVLQPRPATLPPEPQPQPEPQTVSTPAPPPVAVRPAPRPRPTPAPVPESQLLEESRLLGLAVKQLRRERKPESSLQTLSSYFSRFPSGTLAKEAQTVRVDALLALGRRAEALTLLDDLARTRFDGLPRAAELEVTHGEVLATLGHLERAVTGFSSALARTGLPPELEERALFGRAGCLAHLGRQAESQRDLATYLERHPRGRFADRARAGLTPAKAP